MKYTTAEEIKQAIEYAHSIEILDTIFRENRLLFNELPERDQLFELKDKKMESLKAQLDTQ